MRTPATLLYLFVLLSLTTATQTRVQAQSSEQVLYAFTNQLDGGYPTAVIGDSAGNLYGATAEGGTNGTGTVFELSPSVGGSWSETILFNFGPTGTRDGNQPVGALRFDTLSNLYGTTQYGGGGECQFGCGTIFELSPSAGAWTEKVLYRFSQGDGVNPCSQLAFDRAGNLYGTTRLGGIYDAGTVFELSPAPGRWEQILLHSFAGGSDGEDPVHSGLAIDSAGNLYGTTFYGGPNSAGTVFELSRASGKWKKSVLHTFDRSGIGGYPEAGVSFDSSGNLYGTTTQGSSTTDGGVFKLRPSADGKWTYSVLHAFGDGADGNFPSTGVVFDRAGNLYGTTNFGGSSGDGAVYELSPSAKGPWNEEILWDFIGGADGINPNTTPLFLDGAGNIYGSTNSGGDGVGVIFEVTP